VAVVDASVWVAINHEADPAHARCLAWLTAVQASGEGLFAPTLIVAEVSAAIRRLSGEEAKASKVVDQIFALGVVDLVGLDLERVRRAAAVAAATGVRGADAVYLALALERGEILISLDRQQRERGGAVVEVRLP
jgi:predicted nucleic acid-binding protein